MKTDINDITETTYFDDDEVEYASNDDHDTAVSSEFPKKTRWFVLAPLVLTGFCLILAITTEAEHAFWLFTTLMMLIGTLSIQASWGGHRQNVMKEKFPDEVPETVFSYLIPRPLKPITMKVMPFLFTESERMIDYRIQWKQVGDRMLSKIPGIKKNESEEETSYLATKGNGFDYYDDDDDEAV